MARLKISAALRDFDRELASLKRLDVENQRRSSLTRRQLELLTEGVFMAAFRCYENYIEEVFMLYTLEKRGVNGTRVRSYLKPKSFDHSRDLLKSSMPFLDWSSADNVSNRAETFLDQGGPIKVYLDTARTELNDMKTIRNHVAHNSRESLGAYKRLLRRVHGTAPLTTPTPGRHLLSTVPGSSPSEHYLHKYIEKLIAVGHGVAG